MTLKSLLSCFDMNIPKMGHRNFIKLFKKKVKFICYQIMFKNDRSPS